MMIESPSFPILGLEIPRMDDISESMHRENILLPNSAWETVERERQTNFDIYESSLRENSHSGSSENYNSMIFVTPKLKHIIRYGIPSSLRAKYWLAISNGQNLIEEGSIYFETIKNRSKLLNITTIEENPFGVPLDFIDDFCGGRNNESIKDFIKMVNKQNRHITYAPMIPKVCYLLLTFLDEREAYAAIQAMINNNENNDFSSNINDQNASNSGSFWYFSITRDDFLKSSMSINNLTHSKCAKVYNHFNSLDIDITELFLRFIFDPTFIQMPILLTFFDSYIHEGRKVLVRFFLNFLIQETRQLTKVKNIHEIEELFKIFYDQLYENPLKLKEFIKQSFDISLSRNRHIIKAENNLKIRKNTSLSEFSQKVKSFPSSFTARNFQNHPAIPKPYNPPQFHYSNNTGPKTITRMDQPNFHKNNHQNEYHSRNARTINYNEDSEDIEIEDEDENLFEEPYESENQHEPHPASYSSPTDFIDYIHNQTNVNLNQMDENFGSYYSKESFDSENTIKPQSQKLKRVPNLLNAQSEKNLPRKLNLPPLQMGSPSNLQENSFEDQINSRNEYNQNRDFLPYSSRGMSTSPKMTKHQSSSSFFQIKSELINEIDYCGIREKLPALYRSSIPTLVFRLSRDGASFANLLSSCRNRCPHIIFIETNRLTCGAFLSDSPGINPRNGKYFGRCSTFVFSINPTIVYKRLPCKNCHPQNSNINSDQNQNGDENDKDNESESESDKENDRGNELFISVENNSLFVGGPKPAIYIENNLTKLVSGECKTFNSPSFSKSEGGDSIIDIEVFAYVTMSMMK
ncbi:hypothetical protein TRFO_19993 [Tritrichomonas foetus]|uniref:TLDc domain-containing protein n=1 Tax=Tritrichomonas foetus TaxID=1144522 RepID=A0A1J4KHC3_9EUKA|nr:hypothetical protein TRFO_19993 [Tritrichomonas foetus]|eukprot:OHT10595.1 hypothetical protein TRFO_19993 [Tritrichomonas foetus]